MFGGGIPWVEDLSIGDLLDWHAQAVRHFDLRAQSGALASQAAVSALFARKG